VNVRYAYATSSRNPVLIIDDNDDARVMVATLLTMLRFRVVTASNGAEGLVLAREYHRCLIVLDLMMPVMDGRRFRSEQLADPAIRGIPIMVISGKHDAEEVAREMGAISCVRKPISLELLTAQVNAYCESQPTDER
jgi:CheY-like chemotaxis protein